MNQVAKRITQSIAKGELIESGSLLRACSEYRLADVLRPYDEVFGVSPVQDSTGSFLGYRTPRFAPQNKRTKRPLPLPSKPEFWPEFRLSPNLWDGLRALWEFSQARNLTNADLLQSPLAKASDTLVEKIEQELCDYWPLNSSLEMWSWEEVRGNNGIHLYLPCFSYEEEGVWSKEAFLYGPESVASLLNHVYTECEETKENLAQEDRALIDEVGWKDLVESYADSQQEKSHDLKAIENFGETFFRPKMSDISWEMFELHDPPIISGDGGCGALLITEKEEIDFAIEFAEGFYDLEAVLPSYGFECDEDGEATEFIKEVLAVWRADHTVEERKAA